MSKITGLLPNDEAAEQVVKRLSEIRSDRIDWTLQLPSEDHERVFPGAVWRAGGDTSGAGGPLGVPILADYPEGEAIHDEGVDRAEAEVLGRAVEHGGTLIVVDVSDDYEDQVRTILEDAEAQMITKE